MEGSNGSAGKQHISRSTSLPIEDWKSLPSEDQKHQSDQVCCNFGELWFGQFGDYLLVVFGGEKNERWSSEEWDSAKKKLQVPRHGEL